VLPRFATPPRDEQVVITSDGDVGTTLVLGGDDLPSMVLFRDEGRRVRDRYRFSGGVGPFEP